MLVKDLMHKGLSLVKNDMSVLEASKIMTELDIGSLIIGKKETLEGVFSERDLMRKVVSKGLSFEKTLLKDVMTTNIITIADSESFETALTIMESKRIRHLPVINKNGKCTGIIGIRDLLGAMLTKLENENNLILEYLLAVSRVAITILEIADAAGIQENNKIIINHKITKAEFADLTDTTTKILNKVLTDFQEEGLIIIAKNKIEILNKENLKKKII